MARTTASTENGAKKDAIANKTGGRESTIPETTTVAAIGLGVGAETSETRKDIYGGEKVISVMTVSFTAMLLGVGVMSKIPSGRFSSWRIFDSKALFFMAASYMSNQSFW